MKAHYQLKTCSHGLLLYETHLRTRADLKWSRPLTYIISEMVITDLHVTLVYLKTFLAFYRRILDISKNCFLAPAD